MNEDNISRNRLSPDEKAKMISFVTEYIVNHSRFSREEAEKMVVNSGFLTILEEDPDYALERNVEYWGQMILSIYDDTIDFIY